MTTSKTNLIENTLKLFRKKKIMMVKELAGSMKCSIPTTRRRLKGWHAYTSYNQNGRYYVLPDIPRFDQNGLWKFKGTFFSKNGNLKQTVIHLVNQSEAGLNAFEISELLGLPAHTFLPHFSDHPQLQRHRYKGLYIYFPKDRTVFERQKRKREKETVERAKLKLPSDGEAVVILVELIKHPRDTVEKLMRRVRRKGLKVSTEKVRNLLVYHDLVKKIPG